MPASSGSPGRPRGAPAPMRRRPDHRHGSAVAGGALPRRDPRSAAPGWPVTGRPGRCRRRARRASARPPVPDVDRAPPAGGGCRPPYRTSPTWHAAAGPGCARCIPSSPRESHPTSLAPRLANGCRLGRPDTRPRVRALWSLTRCDAPPLYLFANEIEGTPPEMRPHEGWSGVSLNDHQSSGVGGPHGAPASLTAEALPADEEVDHGWLERDDVRGPGHDPARRTTGVRAVLRHGQRTGRLGTPYGVS